MVRFRENRPVIFSFFSIAVFLIALVGSSLLGLVISPDIDLFFLQVVCELGEAVLMLILILAGGMGYVLKRQGNGFGSGIMAGAYFIAIGLLALFSGWATMNYEYLDAAVGIAVEKKHLLSLDHIVLFVILMILVGIAEEFLYRAIVAENLIHVFGSDKWGVIKAALLTGVLFGSTHMVNARMTGLISATVQAISAAVLGIVLTLAYYVSGNIWSVVFLHAFVDFAGMFFEGGVYGTGSLTELTDAMSYSWFNLIGVIPYAVVIAVLLRKRSILRIQKVYPLKQEEVSDQAERVSAFEPIEETETGLAVEPIEETGTRLALEPIEENVKSRAVEPIEENVKARADEFAENSVNKFSEKE